jgi:hypothetical protein
LVGDVLRYRAAAIALVEAEHLARLRHQRRWVYRSELRQWIAQGQKLGLTSDLARRTLSEMYHRAHGCLDFGDVSLDVLSEIGDWRGLFSPTGETYRSLNRTLDNLPGGIGVGPLCNLARVHLERPILDRIELLVVCWAAGYLRTDAKSLQFLHMVMHARRAQIVEAMNRVARFLGIQMNARRARQIADVMRFLADYPEPHTGTIVGLADKTIAWHRWWQAKEQHELLERLGADTAVAHPDIPIPEVAGIEFLSTIGALVQEGARMQHCVASYAPRALEGHCYLFHIEHRGEHATVEVSRYSGTVVQALGAHNQPNKAAAWGERVLRKWAKALLETV